MVHPVRGFQVESVPEGLVFPSLDDEAQRPLHTYGAVGTTMLKRAVWTSLGGAIRLAYAGTPKEGLIPYLNLFFVPDD